MINIVPASTTRSRRDGPQGKRLTSARLARSYAARNHLELTSVAEAIAISTPREYIAFYKRMKGLA